MDSLFSTLIMSENKSYTFYDIVHSISYSDLKYPVEGTNPLLGIY